MRRSPFVLSQSETGQSTKAKRSIKGFRDRHLYFHSPRQVKVQKRNEVSRVAGITFCTFTIRDGTKYKSETKYQGFPRSPFVLSQSETGQSTKAKRSIKGCGHHHLYFHSPRQVKVQKPDGVSRAPATTFCTFTIRDGTKYKSQTKYQGLRASQFVLSQSETAPSTKAKRSIKDMKRPPVI